MAVQTVEKRCNVCGVNVADRPRTKDQAGRYYCASCWQARLDEHALSAPPAALSPPALADSPPSPNRKHDPFGLANPASDGTEPKLHKCSVCRGTFRDGDVSVVDGTTYCVYCRPMLPRKSKEPPLSSRPTQTDVPRGKAGPIIAVAIAAVFCTAIGFWAMHREPPRQAANSSQQPAAEQAESAAAINNVAANPRDAFRRFAGTVVDELNNNMGAVLASLNQRSSKYSMSHTLDNDRPLSEQLPDWPAKTVVLPSFKYELQEPDGVLPLAGDLYVIRRTVTDLGTKGDSGKIKWEKVTYDHRVHLRFVWEDQCWKLKVVEDEEKNDRANIELWLGLVDCLRQLPNPSPIGVTPRATGDAVGSAKGSNPSSSTPRMPDQAVTSAAVGSSTSLPATDTPAVPVSPPILTAVVPTHVEQTNPTPPVVDLSNRESTDAALVVTDNAISPKDMFGVTPTNATLLHANGGKGFNVIRRGTIADGEALLAADQLFGEANVLLLHPRSQDRPCVVDFSRMTRTSKGVLTLRFHNMPGGDCIASAGSATAGVTDIAVTADQWIPLTVAFDHEDVVLRIRATGWYCEHAFTTYAFSTGLPQPAATLLGAAPPPPPPPQPVVAATPPKPITAQQIAERRQMMTAALDADIEKLQRLWDQMPAAARTPTSSIGLKLDRLKTSKAAEVARIDSIPDAQIAADIQRNLDQNTAKQAAIDNAANAAAAHEAEWKNVQDQTIGSTVIPAADIVNWRQTRLDEIDRQLAAYEAKNAYLRNPAYKAQLDSQRKDLMAMTVSEVASRIYENVHFAQH